MLPRISLITPSYQQASYLEECMASVHDQGYAGLEHMVADGGSTDGSKAIIEKYAQRLKWWCSEKDKGQSDAINKGLAHATGDVFGWINSDDTLLPSALQRVGEAFAADPSLDVLTGVRMLRTANGDEPMPLEDATDPEQLFIAPRINQQSTFYRMELLREVGGVEERLNYVMDYELWLQVLFRRGTKGVRMVPTALAVFRSHEGSKTSTQQHRFVDEIASVLHGLCKGVGLGVFADVLAEGHAITQGLRGIPVGASHRERVHAMTVHFLLKWHHTIFSQRDFEMMKRFRRDVSSLGVITPDQQEKLARIDQQLRGGSWLGFRLRRKWKHLPG